MEKYANADTRSTKPKDQQISQWKKALFIPTTEKYAFILVLFSLGKTKVSLKTLYQVADYELIPKISPLPFS